MTAKHSVVKGYFSKALIPRVRFTKDNILTAKCTKRIGTRKKLQLLQHIYLHVKQTVPSDKSEQHVSTESLKLNKLVGCLLSVGPQLRGQLQQQSSKMYIFEAENNTLFIKKILVKYYGKCL